MALNIRDLAISSPDFDHLGPLDVRYTHSDDNASPRLVISGVPDGTAELAIICHDPDAPLPDGFTHWTLYGIPADTTEIGPDADERFRPGLNGFGESGYGGPQPPAGHGVHHYYFWVYALSRGVDGEPDRREFIDGWGDAVIEQNRVIGTFETR